MNIQPKEDIKKFQQPPPLVFNRTNNSGIEEPITATIPTTASTQHLMSAVSDDIAADQTVLSRTLKRKFTELEEITQRLRARLFDVTGDMNIDPDDQFESDLNTKPNEDNDFSFVAANGNEFSAVAGDFDWLKFGNDSQQEQQTSDIQLDLHDDDLASAFGQTYGCTSQNPNKLATKSPYTFSQPASLATLSSNDLDLDTILPNSIKDRLNTHTLNNLVNTLHVNIDDDNTSHNRLDEIQLVEDGANELDCIDLLNSHSHNIPLSINDQDRIQIISEALKNSAITDVSPAFNPLDIEFLNDLQAPTK